MNLLYNLKYKNKRYKIIKNIRLYIQFHIEIKTSENFPIKIFIKQSL